MDRITTIAKELCVVKCCEFMSHSFDGHFRIQQHMNHVLVMSCLTFFGTKFLEILTPLQGVPS